ncbi:hypothetical protein BH10ACT10_BH10ACT10_00530 [soil metagenome]
MTLRMYAARKKWPQEHVRVWLRHSRIHAETARTARPSPADCIDRVIQLSGDLDVEQPRRLLEIADRCPVHRTLNSEFTVRTTLATDDTRLVVAEVPAPEASA